MERRRKTTKCLSLHRRPEATEGGPDAHFTGRGRTGEPKVVLLPRPRLFSGIGWGHVELHALDLPITQVAHQVIDLSPDGLSMPCEDTSQWRDINEGMSSTGPPPSGAFRTSHPRPHAILSLFSSPTPEASLRQMTPLLKAYLESFVGLGEVTS